MWTFLRKKVCVGRKSGGGRGCRTRAGETERAQLEGGEGGKEEEDGKKWRISGVRDGGVGWRVGVFGSEGWGRFDAG